MKRLLTLFLVLWCSTAWAVEPINLARSNPYVLGAGGAAAGVTYVHNLPCDDNAASYTVTNNGTGAAWSSIETNTSVLHSATVNSGTGSFILDHQNEYIRSGANWTSEKFEVKFYYKASNATAASNETIFQVGDGTLGTIANSITLYRLSGETALKMYVKGASGAGSSMVSNNWTNDTNWHLVTLTVDASANPWVVTLKQGTTTITYASGSLEQAAAAFASPMQFGDNSTNICACIIDTVTVQNLE